MEVACVFVCRSLPSEAGGPTEPFTSAALSPASECGIWVARRPRGRPYVYCVTPLPHLPLRKSAVVAPSRSLTRPTPTLRTLGVGQTHAPCLDTTGHGHDAIDARTAPHLATLQGLERSGCLGSDGCHWAVRRLFAQSGSPPGQTAPLPAAGAALYRMQFLELRRYCRRLQFRCPRRNGGGVGSGCARLPILYEHRRRPSRCVPGAPTCVTASPPPPWTAAPAKRQQGRRESAYWRRCPHSMGRERATRPAPVTPSVVPSRSTH